MVLLMGGPEMITFTTGNIIESETEAVVNTVNCVGLMGKGIALQFKQAFPEVFKEYARACRANEVQPGRMLVVPVGRFSNPKYIINFPTKRHWKGPSRIEDIRSGLDALVEDVRRLGIRSISVPPLGCGNGGLDWDLVRPLIESAFEQVKDTDVVVFEPRGAPEPDKMVVGTKRPTMTRGRALLVRLLEQYLLPGYSASLLEVQKLAYFLQVAGEPLDLKFAKQKYGPYAENLNHVLERMEGHFTRGFGDRSVQAQIYLLPGATEEANAVLESDAEAQQHLENVSNLIESFETPYGMELLATAHWVMNEEPSTAKDADLLSEHVRQWSARKGDLFSPDHIKLAQQRLRAQHWLQLR
jgi:O-acetyl-ADP-ribose deacetylase (regulator of RNase III)